MEAIFIMIFIGYALFWEGFKYCLIAIIAQIIFSFSIEQKQIEKVAFMVFFTQGIVVPIALINYKRINNTYQDYSTTIYRSENIIHSLILFTILFVIGFFTYRSIEEKMNFKKWIALIIGYLINIMIMLFIFSSFGTKIDPVLLG